MLRLAALVAATVTALAALTGCQSAHSGLRLTIATGSTDGVYYPLGNGLADAWAGQLGMARPTVVQTNGAPDDIARLRAGTADVGFADADAITDTERGPRKLRALARVYDDYIQVVVRASLPITALGELAGRPVSLGPADSQVTLVADRLLDAAGVHGVKAVALNLNQSIAALRAGTIDAFFWSGGLPTTGITMLAADTPVRLLDLGADPSGVLHTMLSRYRVYGTAEIPVAAYPGATGSVTTLVVPNFLLVPSTMADDVAEQLTSRIFQAAPQLVRVSPAALAIDVRSAIYTEPVPLHPGALAYYKSSKN